MKKLLLIALAFCTFTACDDDDNSDLWDEVKNQGNKIEMLESELEALKLKIEGLNQTFKAITAMLNGGLITKVEEVTDDNGKKGYTFTIQTYSEAAGTQINTYTIWSGDNGQNGEDGENGSTPQIGMEKEEATGLYYWTLNGKPMKDADGNLIYTSKAPQFKITDANRWEISYDDGATWTDVGIFTGTVSSSSITVKVVDGKVVIEQTGKDKIEIPIVSANNLGITFPNVPAAGLNVMKNGVYLIDYKLENASENATVKAEMLNGTNFVVENLPGEKKFKVTVKGENTADVVLVHVYDGAVCMHKSFNITPDASIKAITIAEPEVAFPLANSISSDFEYVGELTLSEPPTEAITLSVTPAGNLPANAVTIQDVTINTTRSATATYKVVVKRSALTLGVPYEFSLVFSSSNANYQVSGEVKMNLILTTTPVKINLTASMMSSPYTYEGNMSKLCDGVLENHWGSNYDQPSCPAGDQTYGVYIDITLPAALSMAKFRYCTRYNNANAVPTAIAVGVSSASSASWTSLFTVNSGLPEGNKVWWEDDVLHNLPDNSTFSKIRFGITASKLGNLITEAYKSTALTELEVYGLY